jgi:ribosomal protein L24E
MLSLNPNAIALLKENPDKINWYNLSRNKNAEAIALLKENPLQIDWTMLSLNPNAIELLKANPDKINWTYLSSNPSIFTYDYEKMRYNCLLFKEDLMKERFHPRNLRKFGSWGHNGGIDEDDE